jgi:UPF0755 protein
MKTRSLAANMFTILIVLGIVVLALLGTARQRISAPGPSAEAIAIQVERDAKFPNVAKELEEKGAIRQAFLFRLAARYSGKDRELKYGDYEIPPRASMEEILELLSTGGNVHHFMTVPEGMSVAMAVERLVGEEKLTGQIVELPPEGSLFPDTWSFQRGEDRVAVIARMQEKMRRVLDEAWENRTPDTPLKSKEELLILASIIEKETRPQEHGKVASVFINRLKRGMKLQTDPTVIYGLTKGQEVLGRGLRRSELNRETAYNTYIIDGLPPTPICNPGEASIRAAADPEETDFLYFVADGTGGHAFAATLEEHNRNVAEWRRIEQERREAEGRSE